MRCVKPLLFLVLVSGLLLSARAASTNSIVWQTATDRVTADVRGEALWPLLEDIAHQTGWHIFVEPGVDRKADVKFKDLPRGEALKKLLGDLNFAYVPKTNEADHLYVFATTMRAATQRVVEQALAKAAAHPKYVANELLVKVKPGTDIDALAKSLGAKVVGRDDKLGLYRLKFDDAAATETALGKLKDNPDVATVDYNYLYDPPVGPQRIANAPVGPVSLALNPPGDNGRVIVGLVDTAIQPLGGDLDQFILKPVSVAGDASVNSSDPTHATSMAETILRAMAAQGGATSAQILPVDVYGSDTMASTWNVALGIQQAVNAGANPINLSLGSSSDSAILNQVIQDAQAQGIVFFAAAGNQPVSTPTYPAALAGVYAVGATQGNQLASYSNYGSFIAIALPGASVVYLGGMSYVVQGTSPATAYASGIAAGAKSSSTMTWAQILNSMQQKFPVPGK
ncbi:MAG TPA: S8 family serine peptidase [bacterium]|nr:S8 family serine peptidase [bacterium]